MIADANKLACKFVEEVQAYIQKTKYIVEPCLDDVYFYFSKYKLSTTLEDCLEHEDECGLSDIIAKLDLIEECEPTIKSCDDLVTINIVKATKLCSYSASLEKLNGQASGYADVVIEDDTIYQPARIKVKVSGCEIGYDTVETGCVSVSPNTAPVCNDIYKNYISINYFIPKLLIHTTGYIKTLRVYRTDDSGILDPTPITLNLAPSNLSAWTACGTCSGITASHLFFGNANWAAAFTLLMDNVARTLSDDEPNASFRGSKIGTQGIMISNLVKHNPAGEWYGIDKNDFYMEWVNNSNVTLTVTVPQTTYSSNIAFIGEDFSVSTTCGDYEGRVIMNGGAISGAITNSNFNRFETTNTELLTPASIINTSALSCNLYTLTASYNTTEEVAYTEWIYGETVLSETNSVQVTDSGTYTFRVVLENGCIITESIII